MATQRTSMGTQPSEGGMRFGQEQQTSDPQAKHALDGQQSSSATATAQKAVERIRETAESAVESTQRAGEGFAMEQKANAVHHLASLGSAARSAAERLRADNHETVAHYVETAADRLESGARTLGDKDLASLLRDAEDLARRRPEIFLGGMALIGLGIARFLKASPARHSAS